MKNRNILSIHNHIEGTYSAPSPENFEILDHEFEKYEIICSEEEYWILEAKDRFDQKLITDLKKEIKKEFNKSHLGTYRKNNSNNQYNSNKEYSKRLSELINSSNNNIILKRKEYQ